MAGPRRASNGTSAAGLRRTLAVALLLAAVQASPCATHAQTAADETVRARQGGPEFQPIGMELDRLMSVVGLVDKQEVRDRSTAYSSFVVFPKMEVTTGYETNLFRNDSRKHDRIVVMAPQVAVRSDWSRHSLSLGLGSSVGRHASNPSEDYEDLRATLAGQLDASDRVSVTASTQVARQHQQRGELLDPGSVAGATTYLESSFVLGANYSGDAFRGLTQLSVTGTDYDSEAGVDNSRLNRRLTVLKVRGAYEFMPGTALFVEPSINDRSYEVKRTSNGRLQDSDGAQMLVGLTWDVSGVTFAEFGVGYLRQDYDDPAFSTISGPSFSARLIWNPTDLLTLEADGGRTISETQDQDASGALVTRVGMRADYALRDNVVLSLSGRYSFEEIEGTNTENDRYVLNVEARYLLNENFYLRALGGYDRTISTNAGSSFSNLRASLTLGAQI